MMANEAWSAFTTTTTVGDTDLLATVQSGANKTITGAIAKTQLNTLITGKAGGQTAVGGTASGEVLTLSSTTNATKGSVDFGTVTSTTGMTFNEVNNSLSIAGDEDSVVISTVILDASLSVHSEGAADLAECLFERHSDTAGLGAHVVNTRSRGTEASETVVADGDVIMRLIGAGYDGTDYAQCAAINFEIDGTPGNNDMPGRIVFLTTPDGAENPITALTISEDQSTTFAGNMSLGTNTFSCGQATIDNIVINANDISTTSGNLTLTPFAGSSVVIDGAASFDGGVITGVTSLTVDNILIDGNDISSSSGNLTLTPVAGSSVVIDGSATFDAGIVTGITSLSVDGNTTVLDSDAGSDTPLILRGSNDTAGFNWKIPASSELELEDSGNGDMMKWTSTGIEVGYNDATSLIQGNGGASGVGLYVGTAVPNAKNGSLGVVSSTGTAATMSIEAMHASTPLGLLIDFRGASPDNNTQYFLKMEDTTTTRAICYSDGDWYNHDGTYGTISDENLKENIIDSTSKLDGILSLRVRNFNRIDSPNKKQIGFIAQELEEIFPSLVNILEDRGANDKKVGLTNTNKYKAIKTTVLIPILVKSFQEMYKKFEHEVFYLKKEIQNFHPENLGESVENKNRNEKDIYELRNSLAEINCKVDSLEKITLNRDEIISQLLEAVK